MPVTGEIGGQQLIPTELPNSRKREIFTSFDLLKEVFRESSETQGLTPEIHQQLRDAAAAIRSVFAFSTPRLKQQEDTGEAKTTSQKPTTEDYTILAKTLNNKIINLNIRPNTSKASLLALFLTYLLSDVKLDTFPEYGTPVEDVDMSEIDVSSSFGNELLDAYLHIPGSNLKIFRHYLEDSTMFPPNFEEDLADPNLPETIRKHMTDMIDEAYKKATSNAAYNQSTTIPSALSDLHRKFCASYLRDIPEED